MNSLLFDVQSALEASRREAEMHAQEVYWTHRAERASLEQAVAVAAAAAAVAAAAPVPPLTRGQSEENKPTSGTVVVPGGFSVQLLTNNNNVGLWWLRRTLGVKIRLAPTGAAPATLEVSANNADAFEVAKVVLTDKLKDPLGFQAELMDRKKVKTHIFVDNSNLLIGAQYQPRPDARGGYARDIRKRVSVRAVHDLVNLERDAVQCVCFGSVRFGQKKSLRTQKSDFSHWEDQGYRALISERDDANKENFVDHGLIAEMQNAILNHSEEAREHGNRTLVLITGDGNENGGEGAPSFLGVVMNAIKWGWSVEVWAWKATCSSKFLRLAEELQNEPTFALHYLDNFRGELVNFRPYKLSKKLGHRAAHPSVRAGSSNPPDGAGGGGAPASAPGIAIASSSSSSSSSDDNNEIDEDAFMCPISFEVINNPVRISGTPHHYEREMLVMWVTENGTCPMTNANVTISDIQEAEPQYLKTLHAFRESGGDSPTSGGGGGGGGAAAAPSAPAPCGACHPCGSHGGSGARADGGDGGGAKPFRVKPCIHGASCRHLKRNGHPENACTFLHEPEHLYPTKPFRVKPCIHGASCRHLKRNGHPENACTFLHEPEHLYPQNFPGKGYGGKGYGGKGYGGKGYGGKGYGGKGYGGKGYGGGGAGGRGGGRY
jgi:hypothetical protein